MSQTEPKSFVLNGYQDYCSGLKDGSLQCKLLLEQQDLFIRCNSHDPKTGEGYYCDLETFLNRITEAIKQPHTQDRLSWFLEYTMDSIEHILHNMHESLSKVHIFQPAHKVNEVDLSTLLWISRQQGNTVKEKLKSKRQIYAPARIWIVDTSENRVFKSFVETLYDTFCERRDALEIGDVRFEEFEQAVISWLNTPEAQSISRFTNLRPNNRLLGDKHYRKIWDCLGWLRDLDNKCQEDAARLDQFLVQGCFWSMASAIHSLKDSVFLQIPCVFSMPQMRMLPMDENSEAAASEQSSSDQSFFGQGFAQTSSQELPNRELTGFLEIKTASDPQFVLNCDMKNNEVVFNFEKNNYKLKVANSSIKVMFNGKVIEQFDSAKLQNGVLNLVYNKFKSLLLNFLFLKENANPKQRFPYHAQTLSGDSCILDFESMLPKLCFIEKAAQSKQAASLKERVLPFKLLGQIWQYKGEILLDCGLSNGLSLSPEHKVISSCDLFNINKNEEELTLATQLFFNKVREHLICQQLYYIVPDAVEEMAQYTVRSQLNLFYSDAQAIPRSIGAVFSMVQDKTSELASYQQVVVLCASFLDSQISITPLIGNKNKELLKLIPESNGFVWERFPSNVYNDMQFVVDQLLPNELKDRLPEVMTINLNNFEALNNMFLQYEDEDVEGVCFLNSIEANKVRQRLANQKLSDTIKKALKDLNDQVRPNKNTPVFFITSDCHLKLEQNREVKFLGSYSALNGAGTLVSWEQLLRAKHSELSLWTDHLPELYIKAIEIKDGRPLPVYKALVDANHKITPKYDAPPIDIRSVEFTLEPNQEFYSIPLTKKEKGQSLRYRMEIHSPSFPLDYPVDCVLKMRYKYGAEKPYTLFVEPALGQMAPFSSIEADWVKSEKQLRNTPIPVLPPAKTWGDIYHFETKNGDIVDLVEEFRKFCKDVVKICQMQDEGRKEVSRQIHITNFSDRIFFPKRNDGEYCFIKLKEYDKANPFNDDIKIICYTNTFKGDYDLFDADDVYLTVAPGNEDNFYKTKAIYTRRGQSWYFDQSKHKIENWIKRKNWVLFISVVIWKEGRSYQDFDARQELRDAVRQLGNSYPKLKQFASKEFQGLCLSVLSRMHKDIPSTQIWEEICQDISNEKGTKTYRSRLAGSVLGDLSLPQQREVHDYLLKDAWGWHLKALSIAYWRCRDALMKQDVATLEKLGKAVCNHLEHTLEVAKRDKKQDIGSSITSDVELILALLTTRDHQDEQIRAVFEGNTELVQNLCDTMEKVFAYYSENPFEVRSFVQLQLDKPENYEGMDDLLYAVNMYLTGEDGANDIVIKEISDDQAV